MEQNVRADSETKIAWPWWPCKQMFEQDEMVILELLFPSSSIGSLMVQHRRSMPVDALCSPVTYSPEPQHVFDSSYGLRAHASVLSNMLMFLCMWKTQAPTATSGAAHSSPQGRFITPAAAENATSFRRAKRIKL
ncbi:hypothetical protein GGR55DRAFT_455111 [Xylaria sp. FL0064]|nr:hypothetical protein GGR55DRAFT_455111 [Xylaria sp. FL0064]